jgi:hypothetical protein
MKTTYDAVNELEGLITRVTAGSGHAALASSERVTAHKICKLISDLKSTKELEVMDIWKNAPEWADRLGILDGDSVFYNSEHYQFCRGDNNKYNIISNEYTIDYFTEEDSRAVFINCTSHNKPQPKPVFTQEMCDNGELPSVGMECVGTSSRGLVMTSWEKGSIIFASPTYTIFKTSNGIEFCCNHLVGQDFKYKPLTPPIELIDGKAYQFTHKAGVDGLHGVYRDNKFYIGGDYVESDNCTNIQPLIAEVK